MADENLQVNPAVENQEQPAPENETLVEGENTETTETEEDETTEEDNTPGGAADVIYAEIRNQITEKHGEEVLTGISSKLSNLEALTEDELNLIADASGKYSKADVEAHINLRYEKERLAEKAAKIDEQEAEAYISEINEIAGGSYQELIDFIAAEAPPSKVKIWNAAIATNDKDTQKDVLKEMAEFRKAVQPAPKPANKASDLGLLTKATTTAATKTSQQQVNPLDGNPLAYLVNEPAGINKLCAIKLDATNPNRDKAIEVLKVVAPDLL